MSSHIEPENSFGFLTSRFRILVYDARGSGDSDGKKPFTDERWISDLEEIRNWAGEEKFLLSRGSYGGFIALGYTLAHPQHATALILRDTWAFGPRGTIRAVVGRHDRITPVEDAEEIHASIGGSVLAIFENSGASPPSEERGLFQERMWEFLSKID